MLKRHVLGFVLGSLLAATVASGQCQQPPQGAALSLNGSSAYVSIPDSSSFDFTRTVTIEFWLRRNNGGEVISQSDGANITSNRAFEVQANGAFFYRADGTGWLELYNDAPTGEWVHIATVIDTTVPYMRKFVNGVLVAQTSTGVNGSNILNTTLRRSTRPVEIGRRGLTCCGGPIYYLSGLVDELRVWNVARTPSQIAASYQGSVPTNSTGLVAYYTFDEGGGSTLIDRTGRGNTGTLQGGATWASVGPPQTPVSILQNPSSRSVCAGAGTTFSVNAGGSSLQFQWRKNGSNIAGANGSSFTIASPGPSDEGSYDCIVFNGCSSATSAAASLSVVSRPVIESHPIAAASCVGSPVTFAVVATGTSPRFQWRKDGNDLPGATGPTLTIASPTLADAGSYACAVTNSCGNAVSNAAALTVRSSPVIISQPADALSCDGVAATFTVVASGSEPRFQWRRDGIDIPGVTSPTLTIATPVESDAGSYDCAVSNACGNATSTAATLVVGFAPGFVQQPQPQALIPGGTAEFSVIAIGSDLGFQWRRNGTPLASGGRIGGATSDTLSIASVASADQGSYDCVVTGPCGTAISLAASLTCTTVFTRQPQGGGHSGGSTITLATSVTTAGATTYRWRNNGTPIFNSQTYAGVSTPTLTIRANDPNDSGAYTLAVTNACGTSISDPAAIDVSCLSDFNLDGGVDGEDLFAFFDLWEQGMEAADVNQDGGVDFGDVELFFEKWEAGC